MALSRILLLILLAQAASVPQTASIEGIVLKLGTTDPISGADVELTRVEGTTAAPLPPGAPRFDDAAICAGMFDGAAPPPTDLAEPKGRFADASTRAPSPRARSAASA